LSILAARDQRRIGFSRNQSILQAKGPFDKALFLQCLAYLTEPGVDNIVCMPDWQKLYENCAKKVKLY
jgi:hypothetical protein